MDAEIIPPGGLAAFKKAFYIALSFLKPNEIFHKINPIAVPGHHSASISVCTNFTTKDNQDIIEVLESQCLLFPGWCKAAPPIRKSLFPM